VLIDMIPNFSAHMPISSWKEASKDSLRWIPQSANRRRFRPSQLPGNRQVKGVTNLVLDHRSAAEMALKHLVELGHKEIAIMKGPTSSSDSEDRWKAIVRVSDELGIGNQSGAGNSA